MGNVFFHRLHLTVVSNSIITMYGYTFGGPATRAVRAIIIANIAVFFLQIITGLFAPNLMESYFGLIPFNINHSFMIWQFMTYMFLHGGVIHILFNMLMLYMFGNELERLWGAKAFVQYYFITGIGAGICCWIFGLNTIGASGAIYGILLAYGLTYPNRIVYFSFLFPIKVKWMVVIMGAVEFLASIGGSGDGIAHIAHMGGLLVGFVYLRGRNWQRLYGDFEARRQRERLKQQFEAYYGEMRRKIDEEKKKGPTIH
jgi:membrane associated rhomboid family serine protease